MHCYKFQSNIIFSLIFILYCTANSKITGERANDCEPKKQILEAPSTKYEYTKRKVIQDVKEFWWYLESILENLGTGEKIGEKLAEVRNRQYAILSQISDISDYDGYNSWREKENNELIDLVQKRISYIQNPKNCSSAKKLLYTLDGQCGFGCQFHRIVICLIISYATGRTLMLDTRNWSYSCDGVGAFEEIFRPISDTCLLHRDYDISRKKVIQWPGTKDAEIVEWIFGKHSRPAFLPPMVPKDLNDRIMRLHGGPVLWWLSQFVKFLWKFQPETKLRLKHLEKEFGSDTVRVGIHIRRNDKIVEGESKYYPVEEYMKYVNEYFEYMQFKRKSKLKRKQVFIASDDAEVFDEIRKKYPEYEVLGDETRADSALLTSRYEFNSLQHLISDIHLLSLSDYIVCTLTSNVCNLAYKIQQQRYVDGSWRIHSLDSTWLSSGTLFTWRHIQKAIYSHKAMSPQELSFDTGDMIFDITNHRDGVALGKNMKNNHSGIYPTYKTIPISQTFSFPTYPDATKYKVEYSSLDKRTIYQDKESSNDLCRKEKARCRSYDTDGNGYIDHSELLKHFPANDTIHEHSKYVDKDQDGKMSIKECLTLIQTLDYKYEKKKKT